MCSGCCVLAARCTSDRCSNERLKEHVSTTVQSHLGIHCINRVCKLEIKECTVVAKHHQELTHDIIEANIMHQLHDVCVSVPSVALTKKEIAYLAQMQ